MEDKAKQIFDEAVEKQGKLAKKLVLGILGGMGVFYAVLGLIFLCIDDATFNEIGMVFSIVGVFLAALGILLYFVIPTKGNYERYKTRVHKYGYMSTFEINAKLAELEERVAALEDEKKDL